MILNLYKPLGLTSHDVVNQVRKITGERKVGHGGTLDPLAEGVLVIGVGRESTKQLKSILEDTDKEYEATIEFGKISSTDDSEGDITDTKADLSKLTLEDIETVLKKFVGTIEQVPPIYSAIKVKGQRAYKLARSNKPILLSPRKVNIKTIELLEYNPPELKFITTVSSGTYVRSLARDIGASLNVGGYLKTLRRTRVGRFFIGDSLTLEDLPQQVKMMDT